MQIRYPKSFLKLLAVGFALVALPLVLGLVGSAVSLNRLAHQSQQAVYQSAQVTQASRVLVEALTSLERSARQYVVLGDPSLWDNYRLARSRFREAVEHLNTLPLSSAQHAELASVIAQEQSVHAALDRLASAGKRAPVAALKAMPATLARYEDIAAASAAMLKENSAAIDREVASLRELAQAAQRTVFTQMLALLPVAAFLVIGFTYVLTRPIAQIDHGIRALGDGRFDNAIAVSGPEDLEQLGRRLDWLRLRLVELEAQKSRFLRHVSHELKTPLTALREGSDLLAEEALGPLNDEQREIARILRTNSDRLNEQIQELLRYGALEFSKTPLKRLPVKPMDIVTRVIEAQGLAMAAKELVPVLEVEDFVVQADPEPMRVMLDNLVSNAIKFSPQGGRVTIRAYRADAQAVIEVADQGPGIAAEDLDKVFDPYYRGRAPVGGKVNGTGLGLSISRDHVLAHGGRIEALTGGGGLFRITLPLESV